MTQHEIAAPAPRDTNSAEIDSSRRGFLAVGLGSAAVLAGFGARAHASSTPAGSHTRASRSFLGDKHFLLDRATFGWTSAEQTRVDSMGYRAWLDEQIAF